ncbi:MAG: lytic murein transglycosylase [Hyphomicrobiaceae bacterium]|nr:lytic murein transglycosylase [Hyphomicrobiaceae bacterium]
MRGASIWGRLLWVAAVLAVVGLLVVTQSRAAEPSFKEFLEGLWPDAKQQGIRRTTFDVAIAGLEPDLSLPDLVLPGKTLPTMVGQAEFTREPREYLNAPTLERLAGQGRALGRTFAKALDGIEEKYGVDRYSVLAIWGRETAFGTYKLPHDAIRVLATQAYVGRRKEMFRAELILAIKMLEDGIPRAKMRASWAGAIGQTQFLPSEFYAHARDHDSDGLADLFDSVPDALASAARQLQAKGWVRGRTWGYEVVIPASSDCSLEGPPGSRAIREWMALGFKRAGGKPFPAEVMDDQAYLMSPAGAFGPSFLALENFQVIRRYNTSDLYATFVGNLADRIAGGGDFITPWKPIGPQRTALIRGVQTGLQKAGYPVDKIDGFIGSNTRRLVGTYQKSAGLPVDCWPGEAVLKKLGNAASR